MTRSIRVDDAVPVPRSIEQRITTLERLLQGSVFNWTPTFTQNGVVITNTKLYAEYVQVGHLVVANCAIQMSGPGTVSTPICVPTSSWPIVPDISSITSTGPAVGSFLYIPNGNPTRYAGSVGISTSVTGNMYFQVSGNTNVLGTLPSFTVASGDQLYMHLCYIS